MWGRYSEGKKRLLSERRIYVVMISKRRLAIAVAAFVVSAAACAGGDERTEQVVAGMSRDSALATISMGTPGGLETLGADSLRNVWRRTQYLMNGVNIEVIWYSPSGEKWMAADTVPEERVIPVVVLDGKVAGVGRSAYNKVAEAYNLPPNRY